MTNSGYTAINFGDEDTDDQVISSHQAVLDLHAGNRPSNVSYPHVDPPMPGHIATMQQPYATQPTSTWNTHQVNDPSLPHQTQDSMLNRAFSQQMAGLQSSFGKLSGMIKKAQGAPAVGLAGSATQQRADGDATDLSKAQVLTLLNEVKQQMQHSGDGMNAEAQQLFNVTGAESVPLNFSNGMDQALQSGTIQIWVGKSEKRVDQVNVPVGKGYSVGVGQHTVYELRVHTSLAKYQMRNFTVYRRFSDFDTLYQMFRTAHKGHIIPAIPDKSFLGSKLGLEKFEAKRAAALHRFMCGVAEHPVLATSDEQLEFCSPDQQEDLSLSNRWKQLKNTLLAPTTPAATPTAQISMAVSKLVVSARQAASRFQNRGSEQYNAVNGPTEATAGGSNVINAAQIQDRAEIGLRYIRQWMEQLASVLTDAALQSEAVGYYAQETAASMDGFATAMEENCQFESKEGGGMFFAKSKSGQTLSRLYGNVATSVRQCYDKQKLLADRLVDQLEPIEICAGSAREAVKALKDRELSFDEYRQKKANLEELQSQVSDLEKQQKECTGPAIMQQTDQARSRVKTCLALCREQFIEYKTILARNMAELDRLLPSMGNQLASLCVGVCRTMVSIEEENQNAYNALYNQFK